MSSQDLPGGRPDDDESYSYRESFWGRLRKGVARLTGRAGERDAER